MNIEDTLAPKSDQLDAVDLLGGEQTFTISGVRRGNNEQPVQIDLAEFPRTWRPSKGMRRVLVACWGPDASKYVGRRVTLYCDTEVVFGSEKVGGTRIRALSHIDGPKSVPMIVKRGRSSVFTVQPLPDAPAPQQPAPEPTAEQVAACADINILHAMWNASGPEMRARIEARRDEITGGGDPA